MNVLCSIKKINWEGRLDLFHKEGLLPVALYIMLVRICTQCVCVCVCVCKHDLF